MPPSLLLGIDQGTSGSKAVIVDAAGQVRGFGYRPLARLYPQPGWVEQEPAEVVQGVREAIDDALRAAGCRAGDLLAAGITCQRNTAFAWDAADGRAIGRAITWQDLRTTPLVAEARARFDFGEAWQRLGYPPGPYMAALHLAWRMQHDAAFAEAAARGALRVGLSAAYLIHALGRAERHVMDRSLVQALGFYDFRAGAVWEAWRAWTGLPAAALPTAVPTLGQFGVLCLDGAETPVLAQIGDQQAALFGHGRRTPGAAECTHGTASYVKLFLGAEAPVSERINVYCAWQLDGAQTYCLEAPTTVTGAAIRWMGENLGLFADHSEMEQLAAAVPDAGGVIFIPALTGLEVPYHRPDVRGTFFGLTLSHQRGHIVRAFLEAIGYQLRAILETMRAETGATVRELLVGGGVSHSDLACQVQADLIGLPVARPSFGETTGYAAALLAGLGAGVWPSAEACPVAPGAYTRFEPQLSPEARDAGYARWQRAIALAQAW